MQHVEVSLFMLALMTVPLLKYFVDCRRRHITSGLPNYEGQKINAHMEEPVGFVVDIVAVNVFFLPILRAAVVTMIKLNFHDHISFT